MGQINTTPGAEGENGAEPGSNYIAGVPNGEDDSRSSNVSVDGSQTPMEAVQCVKTRIDMLIEDCLNVRDSSGEDSNKDEKKLTNNSAQSDQSPDKTADNKKVESSEDVKQGEDHVTVDDSDKQVSECSEKVSNTAAEVVDKNGGTTSEQGAKKTPYKEVKPEGNYSVEIKSESTTENMAASKEGAQRHNRTVTTFQTFIDKVLDSSLKQVPDQDNGSTNILKLCQESMQPNAEASKPMPTKTTASESVTKPKFDRSCTKIKPERKITLKDHIERFLESSFRDEIGVHEKGSAESSDRKKEVGGAKNGFENFNAQGLVNNMITQGLQINKLLSPPIVVNHSKNPQRVPDIRVCTEYQRNEFMKNQMKDIKSEKQVQNVPYKPDAGVMRNNGYQNTGPRVPVPGAHPAPGVHHGPGAHLAPGVHPVPGAHPAQLSPGQMSVSSSDGNKHVKDIRANHHVRMTDDGRRDYPYSRHYPVDFNTENLHSHHQSVAHPGYHQRVDHNIPVTTLDQQMHGAMYPMPYSARTSVAPAQFPPVAVQQTGVSEEQRSPHGRPSHHHHPHCMCPVCLSHQRQTLDVRDPKKDYSSQRRSPNIPAYMVSHEHQIQMRGHHLDSSQAMMRPSHSKMPPCPSAAYQTMPKLLPQQPPITSTKEYGSQLLVPGIGYPQGRRPSLPENSPHKPFTHQGRGGEYNHSEQPEDFARRMDAQGRGGNHSPYPARPSSMPSQEHSSHEGGMFMRRSPAISDSGSHSSDISVEAPLDLSVKKPKKDIERPRSSSYSSGAQHSQSHKKLNPSNTFLRHLENSVDKYCQELSGPMESPGKHIRQQMNRSLTPNESKHVLQYTAQSPRLPSPHNVYNLQHRKLPSPQFTGGITMGQPLVESRSQQIIQRSVEMQYSNSAPQQVSQTSTVPAQNSQVAITTAPTNFDMNSKRNINSISKHEPIQNIIGNHDPNDILYLICTICTQTYGSPYGFRKHFRNQHGFEPRAEHTIVQTISATKTALHGPIPVSVATSDFQSPPTSSPPVIKSQTKENSAIVVQNTNPNFDRKSGSGSPPNRKSPSELCSESFEENSGNEEKCKKIAQGEISERRCLECPECGKTFQLNDFGSYKRHCRQHNTVKVSPYTCSDCHLSFPDQKALKEHHQVHYNESHISNSDTSKIGESVNSVKTASPGNCFGCVKCDKQFTNIAEYNSHKLVHEQPPKLSPQIELNTRKDSAAGHSVASSSNTLSVIPSQCIVKQAAESMTAQVCPDSSWDDSNKSIPTPVDEKQDENTDSGYSSSVGSNTMLNLDDNKLIENCDKKPAASVARQKSLDSNSGSNEDLQSSEDNFVYKHKKFSQHRKRENPSTHSSETTPSKQAKISTCQELAPPVSSSTTPCVGYKCDSSEAEDTKSVEKLKADSVENTEITSTKEAMFVDKQMKEVNVGKGEARHNLPFVWDRTTRSQRKTK